jgi:hypothetical protein
VLSFFFGYLQYLKLFIPLRQTLFLETVRRYSESNQGNTVSVPFQKSVFDPATAGQKVPCEHIVMVENPNYGPNFGPFTTHSFT